MKAKPKTDIPDAPEPLEQPDRRRHALLGEHVLQALGEPKRLHAVHVRPLWDGHYRVNVFVASGDATVVISDSFFLVTDDDGNIVTSTPAITRQY